MKSYLNVIVDICSINKELTFHIAIAHLHTTQHYAKILDRKVSEDMKSLKEKIATSILSTKINLAE